MASGRVNMPHTGHAPGADGPNTGNPATQGGRRERTGVTSHGFREPRGENTFHRHPRKHPMIVTHISRPAVRTSRAQPARTSDTNRQP